MLFVTNKSTEIKLTSKILEYSDKNNIIKLILLYSILNPEINSDSPSEKSKGVRLVSAKIVIIQIIIIGKVIIKIGEYFCIFLVSIKFICSVIIIIDIINMIRLISYEINCEIVRIIPIKA